MDGQYDHSSTKTYPAPTRLAVKVGGHPLLPTNFLPLHVHPLVRPTVEIRATMTHKEGKFRLNLPPLVVETPSHRAAMERQPGMIPA